MELFELQFKGKYNKTELHRVLDTPSSYIVVKYENPDSVDISIESKIECDLDSFVINYIKDQYYKHKRKLVLVSIHGCDIDIEKKILESPDVIKTLTDNDFRFIEGSKLKRQLVYKERYDRVQRIIIDNQHKLMGDDIWT